MITLEENDSITKELIEMELKKAFNSISDDSMPGSDGFGSGFYKCWEFIKKDLLEATKYFFSGGMLPRFYTSSFIILIPNVKDHSSFEKFKPISLCSISYKIF